MPSPRHRLLLLFLALLPRNLVSRLAGRLVSIPLPPFLRARAMRGFGRIFGVDFDEVRDPLGSFRCIQDFFVRRLKEGARPIDDRPEVMVSPCDGAWGQWGTVENGLLLQVKGRPYSLTELLGSESDARAFEGGVYATLYLSPKDYHRFHTPARVEIEKARYLPGSLWPVNQAGVEGVDSLFARNERLVAFMRLREAAVGEGQLALVAVGATMVGKVKVVFDELETNLPGVPVTEKVYDPAPKFERGEEWGRFEFGSTLVLVASEGLVELDGASAGTPVRLGLPLAHYLRVGTPAAETAGLGARMPTTH